MMSNTHEIDVIKEEISKIDKRLTENQKAIFAQAARIDAQQDFFKKFLENLEMDVKEVKVSNEKAIKELRQSNAEAMDTFNQVRTSLKVLIFLGGIISTLLTILITIGDFFGT